MGSDYADDGFVPITRFNRGFPEMNSDQEKVPKPDMTLARALEIAQILEGKGPLGDAVRLLAGELSRRTNDLRSVRPAMQAEQRRHAKARQRAHELERALERISLMVTDDHLAIWARLDGIKEILGDVIPVSEGFDEVEEQVRGIKRATQTPSEKDG